MALRNQLPILQDKIHSNQHKIWKPPCSIPWKPIQAFVKGYANPQKEECPIQPTNKISFPETLISCKKIELLLNPSQETILKRWSFAYTKMYNQALYCLKQMSQEKRLVLNYQTLRTHYLKASRNAIIQDSFSKIFGHHTQVKTHMMDGAIQLVCANYKSAISNYKAGNIKYFRIRYWKKKTLYRLDIEPNYITSKGICSKILGSMNAVYDNQTFEWTTIDKTCQLQYDTQTNRFYLLVPKEIQTEKHTERKPWIALDPGIRTFLTGISENEVLKIGDNLSPKFKKHLNRLDKTVRMPLSPARRKQLQIKLRDKIKHMAEDLHWKASNFLVKNYDTVLIGDMSAKGIVRGKGKGLDTNVKRTLMALSLFKFHQRLAFKAQQHHCHLVMVNEAYTTKVCSCCGTVNQVGGARVFTCTNCHHECDRDVDGARCIAIKGLF